MSTDLAASARAGEGEALRQLAGPYPRDPRAGAAHASGLLVLTLAGSKVCALTRFGNSALPRSGLPRTLPPPLRRGPCRGGAAA